jgi:hypothetical protein
MLSLFAVAHRICTLVFFAGASRKPQRDPEGSLGGRIGGDL